MTGGPIVRFGTKLLCDFEHPHPKSGKLGGKKKEAAINSLSGWLLQQLRQSYKHRRLKPSRSPAGKEMRQVE